jgi:hypothetical protein
VIDWPSYTDSQKEIISATIPSTATHRPEEVIEWLESVWFEYELIKKDHESEADRKGWGKIETKLREVLQLIEKIEDPRDPVLVAKPPSIYEGNDDYDEQLASRVIEFREMLARSASAAGKHKDRLDRAIADKSLHIESLYTGVLDAWVDAGCKFSKGSDTKTGGPQARFFAAAVSPILGDSTPKTTSLGNIFWRNAPRYREGGKPNRFTFPLLPPGVN